MSETFVALLQILTILGVIGWIVNLIIRIVKKSGFASVIVSGIVVVVFIIITSLCSSQSTTILTTVQNQHPDECAITYGQAINNFMSDVEWKYFEADTGEVVGEVSGNCYYNENEVKITIQFLTTEDMLLEHVKETTVFKPNYIGINDVKCTGEEANGFFNAAFSSYAEANGLEYESRYFFSEEEETDSVETDGSDATDGPDDTTTDSY